MARSSFNCEPPSKRKEKLVRHRGKLASREMEPQALRCVCTEEQKEGVVRAISKISR